MTTSNGRPLRAAGYVRVSTTGQAGADRYGIPAQIHDVETRVRRRGYTLVELVQDAGISGTRADREGLDTIRALVRRGALDVVVIPDVTRLSRDLPLFVQLEQELRAAGVRVESTALPMTIADDEDDEDAAEGQVLMLYQQALDGAKELRTITRRFRQGRLQKARDKGLRPTGRPTFGYTTDPRRKGVTLIDEREAPSRVLMFDWIRDGGTLHSLARELDRRGVRTRYGRPWGLSTLHGLLTNPDVIGQGFYNRRRARRGGKTTLRDRAQWIPIPTPRLVSDETFEAVQRRLDANRTRAAGFVADPAFFLRSLVVCGTCQRRLRAHKVGGQRRYYACETPRCRPSLKAPQLEARVWEEVEAQGDPATLEARIAASERRRVIDDLEISTAVEHARAAGEKAERQVRHLERIVGNPELDSPGFQADLRAARVAREEARTRQLAAEARAARQSPPSAEALQAHARAIRRTLRGRKMADPVNRATFLRLLGLTIIIRTGTDGLAVELSGPLCSGPLPLDSTSPAHPVPTLSHRGVNAEKPERSPALKHPVATLRYTVIYGAADAGAPELSTGRRTGAPMRRRP
jgi:site-specific DNA recombinase